MLVFVVCYLLWLFLYYGYFVRWLLCAVCCRLFCLLCCVSVVTVGFCFNSVAFNRLFLRSLICLFLCLCYVFVGNCLFAYLLFVYGL